MRLFGTFGGIEYYYTDKFLYIKQGTQFHKLALFDKHFYKLRLYKRIPILEIDGLRMQLTKDFRSPLDHPKAVVKELNIKKNDIVLDTCMGLGYLAIEASKLAQKVHTYEISSAVMQLAKKNPFSKNLFSSSINVNIGDIYSEVKGLKDKSFDIIIHDPPRFSHAPALYSAAFYRELFRISKKGTRIFHYVGAPGKHKGRSIEKEVMKRLEKEGFRNIKFNPRLQGLFLVR
jgi:uncharacterized protein